MTISLTPETQRLLKEQMAKSHLSSPDELVRLALKTLEQNRGEGYDELDSTVRQAIEDAEGEYRRGEGREWAEVRRELRERFVERK
jgi:Arc/MetJ-type ribon-helix-helix transcriptional regulator